MINFLRLLLLLLFSISAPTLARAETRASGVTNVPVELTFKSANSENDRAGNLMLDLLVTDPNGTVFKIPAFWDGGDVWKVRYASSLPGKHFWKTECSDKEDAGLHGISGEIDIAPYSGGNPLYLHGPVRVNADRTHFEYSDGASFFWLGDTWWMGLSGRLHWPDEFQELAADRKAKGFTVVQIVAGLYPDMPPFDARGANEAGFPWEKDYAQIRPRISTRPMYASATCATKESPPASSEHGATFYPGWDPKR